MPVSAARSLAPVKSSGKPLPWKQELRPFYDRGINFLHGQVIMLAGFPGSGKSLCATWWADLWDLPTLYMSADTSDFDMITRLASLRTPYAIHEVKKILEDDGPELSYVEDELRSSKIQFSWDDAPSISAIEEQILAWVEVNDSYPPLVIVDNLVDLDLSDFGDNKYDNWKQALLCFKGWARNYGITTIVLHHALEHGKPEWPAPRKLIDGKISASAELSFTVALDENSFRIAPVKNRSGMNSPSAEKGLVFTVMPERMSFQFAGSFDKSRDN